MENPTLLLLIFISRFWWIILPIILFFPLKALYFYWIRWDVWYKKNKWILLEVKAPKEILKPFKAMEDIFNILWGVYDGANWREIWCEGEIPWGPYWFSCEIVSLGGKIHFYFRILEEWRNTFESAFYSQFPDVEISLVEDYTQKVPQDVPNKDWDLYAEDYSSMKDYLYPIKTYSAFFEPQGERITKEEKRIDPLDSLLEGLSKIRSDEQFWFQIVVNPITNKEVPFITRGKVLIDKLAHRPEKPKPRPMLLEAADVLVTGEPPAGPKEAKEFIPPEMKLTPGERDLLIAVGNKISKFNFKTWIRMVHLYKRDLPAPRISTKLARSYLLQFATQDLNGLVYWGATRTRIHYFLPKRRLYLRKRRLFRLYCQRLPSTFPWSMEGKLPVYRKLPLLRIGYKSPGIGGIVVLNSEELATIFHFPSKIIIPTIPYVESKKGGPPPALPV